MTTWKPKYGIDDRLKILQKGLTISDLVYLLELDFRITRQQFDHDRGLEISDCYEIPEDRLSIYAFMLQTEPGTLKNF